MFRSLPISKITSRLKHGVIATAFIASQLVLPISATGLFMGHAAAAAGDLSVGTFEGQNSDLSWSPGNNTQFAEGDYVNYRFPVTSSTANANGKLYVLFSKCMFTSYFNLYDSTAPATVTSGSVTTAGSDWSVPLTFAFTAVGTATVHFTLRISDTGGDCNGSSSHVALGTTVQDKGDFGNIGSKDIPIPANSIYYSPSLTITKTVNGGNALPSDFWFTVSPAINGQSELHIPVGQSSVTVTDVNPDGTFVITEHGPAGYSFSSGTGTNCSTTSSGVMTATVTAGRPAIDATCNFTNNIQTGSITISKDAIPNSAQDFAFTTSGTGLSNFSLDDDSDATLPSTRTFTGLLPGTYTVTEAATTGWDLTGLSCSGATTQTSGSTVTITLPPNGNVSCTYTNKMRGHIVVHKVTVPANDGTSFPVTASGGGTIYSTATQNVTTSQDVTYEVAQNTAGTPYQVAESVPGGWSQTGSSNCSAIVVNTSSPVVNGVPTETCTITNTKLAKLKIVKDAVPNNAQDFAFTTSGTGLSNFSLDDDSDPTLLNNQQFSNLTPGTYTVTEAAVANWKLTGLACSGLTYDWNGTTNVLSVTLAAGADVTCTFTNTQLGSISGTKFEVDAGAAVGGTKTLAGWTICIDANHDTVCNDGEANTDVTDANGNFSFSGLLPGVYSLLENLQSGWTQIFSPSSVNLSAGQDSTGNNFGNFENGSISGVKFNDHNGDGTKDTSDENLSGWTVNLEDANNTILQTQVTDGIGYSFTNLAPGTYKVCEVGQTGWVQTYPGGDGCHTTVIDQSGETNTDDFGNQGRGTITVSKNLDDGFGNLTKDVTGWTWNYDGTYGTADNIAAGTSSVASVPAGSYTISENNQSDYHFASLVCSTVASISGATYTLTVTPGAKVTCTYTNVRNTGTLILKKNVVNDNGGTATASDFNLHVMQNGNDVTNSPAAGSESGTSYPLPTGRYTVSEDTPPTGYTQTSIVCDGQTTATVDVTSNVSKTCVITNDDVAPKLTLVKYVTKDNGGTANPTDFKLSATPKDNQFTTLSGDGGATGSVQANEGYDLSETNLPGYSPSGWFCGVGGQLSGSTVTLAPGDDVTCSITNDDVAPLITVAKTVINLDGGTLQVSDFPLYVGALQVTSGTQTQITLAGSYAVTEQGNDNYSASAWSGDCDALGNVTMVVGGIYNCYITNNDIAPQLTVIKHVVNTNTNRTDTADDFTMNVTGTNVSSPSFPGDENGTTVTLKAGSYSVTEQDNSNYTVSYSADCDSSMQIGEHKTCTVTNTAKLVPHIHVVKSASTDNAYIGDTVTYTFTVTNTGNTPLSVDEVNDNVAGDGTLVSGDTNSNNLLDVGETWLYTVDYTVPANSGDDVHNTVTVCGSDVEETQVCDHSDHHLHVYHPTISVTKYVYTDADSDDGTFHLNIDGHTYATGGDGTTTGDIEVVHGTHTVAETGANGTDLSDYDSAIACYVGGDYIGTSQENPSGLGTSLDDVAVQQDQHADCYIYNQRHAHLTVIKDAVPNDPQPFNFTLEKFTPCYDFGIESFSNLTQIDEQCNDYTNVDNFQLVDNTDPLLATKTESLSAGNIWQEQDSTTYRLSEAATAGWDLTGIDCGDVETNVADGSVTLVLHSGQNVTCTYTNTKRASLTIAKDAQPNGLQMFNFTSDIDGAKSFSLMDDGTGNFNSKTMSNLLPGTYTVTEAATDNWSLNGVSCGDGVTMKLDGRTLTVTLAPGANVTCTFTNAQGAVLGAAVTTPLVNTGNSIWVNVLVGLTALLTTLGLAVATRRSAKA